MSPDLLSPQMASVFRDVCSGVAAVFSASAVVYGTTRGIPILQTRARLARERDAALSEAAILKRATEALRSSEESWQSSLTGVLDEVKRLRSDVGSLKRQLFVSVQYIASLIDHLKRGGRHETMPAIPEELRDEVLRVQQQAANDEIPA